jgi:predicted enzyme related to lactoylglutathione lyase
MGRADEFRTRLGSGSQKESERGGVMNLNSILIGSEDPQGLADYYTRLFGEPTWADGGYTGWMIGTGAVTVGPHDQVKGKNTEPGRVIWNIETADVKSEFDRLVAAGATSVREPYAPGDETEGLIATLADPDGNYFQLMSPMGPPDA